MPPTPPEELDTAAPAKRRALLRRHFFLFAAVAVLALMILAGGLRLLAGSGKEEGGRGGPGGGGGPGGREQQVAAVTVAARPFTSRIEALGVAKGREAVTITSGAAELVARVRFRDGQFVQRGQVLVDLQSREQGADVGQAQAAVGLAKANLDRWQTLYDKGIAAKASLDEYRAIYQQALATLAAARARLGDRTIRAPFSGVVGLTNVAAGALINPGTPIVTLDDIRVVRVDFPVPERYLGSLRPGLVLQARADAFPNEVFTGRIALLDSRIDERTRAITARAEFPNPGLRIRPGMMLRISIEQGVRVAPSAPESAVQFEADTAYAYKIVNRDGKMIAQRVTVRRGANEGGQVEILEGLQVGDRIVADGLNRIQPNAAVRVGPPRARPGEGAAGKAGGPGRRTPAP